MADNTTRNIPLSLLVSMAITLLGWGVTFGVCQARIEQNAKDIAKIESRQTSLESLLQSINVQLVELNTKVSLIIDGKVPMEKH